MAKSSMDLKDAVRESMSEMFVVLSLIHAVFDLRESGGCLSDIEKLTSVDARINTLLILARDQMAQAIDRLDV